MREWTVGARRSFAARAVQHAQSHRYGAICATDCAGWCMHVTRLNVSGVPFREEGADPVRRQGAGVRPRHEDVRPHRPVQRRSGNNSLVRN
jgi:hypothetical protein